MKLEDTLLFRIGGYHQFYCRIYRQGTGEMGWACDCETFARDFDCDHASQAAALRNVENQVIAAGSTATRQ